MGYSRNARVNWLLARSYGQGGAVAVPNWVVDENLNRIEGEFPAGVSNILDRLIDQYAKWPENSGEKGTVEWCLLIGGPGNGKSEALRKLAGALLVDLEPKRPGLPAPRTVPTLWPERGAPVVSGLEIVFINDASIPRQDANPITNSSSLFLDLRDCVDRFVSNKIPVVLFGNVNRGILIEEKDALRNNQEKDRDSASEFASQAIEWLANPPEKDFPISLPNVAGLETRVPIDTKKPFYGQFTMPLRSLGKGTHDIIVHAIYLDVLSLLEPKPGKNGPAIDFSTEPPVVADYQTYGGFSENDAARETTVAGEVLLQLTDKGEWEDGNCIDSTDGTLCEAYEFCPFAQNAKWLRTVELQRTFLDALRSLEIAAGRRLTYRDLLSNYSLSILGEPEKDWLMRIHPCAWVEDQARAIKFGNSGSRQATVNIVSHRVYTNLFPTPSAMAWRRSRSAAPLSSETLFGTLYERLIEVGKTSYIQTFEKSLSEIDPARDSDPWQGIRTQVIEAVESLEVLYPTDQVLISGILPADAHSSIERVLDKLIREEIITELSRGGKGSSAASQRARTLRKWRYVLLSRQVGLALGCLTFKHALRIWLKEQENALRGRPDYLELGNGIKNLILPTSASQLYIAPVRPRTYGLDPENLPPNALIVTIPSSNLRVGIVTRGDTLLAEIRQFIDLRKPPELIASMVIDLAVAREALLNVKNTSKSFTEIDSSAFARIERARASLVGRDRLRQAQVLFSDDDGKLFRIIENPGGKALLRVQAYKE